MTCREIKTTLWICNDLTYGREPFYRNRALEGKSQNKNLMRSGDMKHEIMKMLELIQEGKLSNSDAAEILSALKEESAPELEKTVTCQKA